MTPPPVKPFRFISCAEWGAAPPRRGIVPSPLKIDGALVHHTAGHHPELDHAPSETYAEAVAYAKVVQRSHTSPSPSDPSKPWSDTGNNILVTRNGYIFEGRHRTLELLKTGHMPISAHCPGQNGSPGTHAKVGVEFEHLGHEPMTAIQYEAGVWVFTQICKYGKLDPLKLNPKVIGGHKDFFATACPDVLYARLPELRLDVHNALKAPAPVPKPKPAPKISGHWQVTKTFHDGHSTVETTGALRLWTLKQGDLVKKGVRDVRAHWVETG